MAGLGGLPQYTFLYGGSAYFTALKAAGMTESKALSLYGVTLYQLAEAIDNLWNDLNTNGFHMVSGLFFPRLGDTSAEQTLDLISASAKMTDVGSPICGGQGVTYNGTTQYSQLTGTLGSVGLTTSLGQVITGWRSGIDLSAANRCPFGSVNTTTSRWQVVTSASNLLSDVCTTTGRFSGTLGTYSFIANGCDGTNSYINLDGTTTSYSRGGTIPSQIMYFGAQNNAGTAQFFVSAALAFAAVCPKTWNTTNVNGYKNAYNSFAIAINRSTL